MKINKYKLNIIIARIILLLFFLLSILFFVNKNRQKEYVAKVNGRKIYSYDYLRRLKQQNNEAILKQLIEEELIKKEAQDKKIKISNKEIDDEYKKIKENITNQGKDFKDELKSRNMNYDDLINQIYIQKLISRLVNLNINVTSEDIDKFITENKDSLPKNVKDDQLRSMIKSQVAEKLQSGKVSNWMESLYRKAKISYY